jgi:hypothetical protein
MQPDQGRGLSLLKVAMHGIPDLTVQLLKVVGLRVDGRSHGAGPKGVVVGLVHDKQDLVHFTAGLLVEVWQRLPVPGLPRQQEAATAAA